MVREASRREKKYEAKVDAEVLSRQTTALKPLMVKGQRQYFPAITSLEEKVKKLVEAEGVTTLEVRDYLNFGREMFELSRKFQGTTLNAEAQLKVNKWVSRGLVGSLLVKIAQLEGVTPTAPALPSAVSKQVIGLDRVHYYYLDDILRIYFPLNPTWSLGESYFSDVEADVSTPMPKGTFTRLKIAVKVNTTFKLCQIALRVNGVTKLFVNIPAGATGIFTTTGNISVNDGDLCNYRLSWSVGEEFPEGLVFIPVLEFQQE